MRVLFAVDGSAGSFDAIRQVASLLRPGRDQIAFYCRPPEVSIRTTNIEKSVVSAARDGLATSIFGEARKLLSPQMQEHVHTITGRQDPKRGINIAAEQWAADLIVMGARGLNMFGRLVLGSVSRAVVHVAKCPVWIARPTSAEAWLSPRVLLACECAESGKGLTEVLGQLSWPELSRFTAMTVIPSIFAGQVPDWLEQQARGPDVEAMARVWVHEHAEEVRTKTSSLQKLVTGLAPPFKSMRTVVEEGQPGHLILATAVLEHCNLVVVGTHPKSPLKTTILGSTSEAVLNHAECSVLVIPHRETP